MEKSWPAVVESVPEICRFVYHYAIKLGFTPQKAKQLELATEEMVSNIVKYAFPCGEKDEKGEIKITVEKSPTKLVIHLSDVGVPFNPLEAAEPDIHASIEERPIGGLGIFLARRMVDDIQYRREENKNVLILVKFL
jgi:anti-sigma regulatory factor (Ser/Thr protein kinase)